MNLSNLRHNTAKRNAENEADVKFITNNLIADGYTPDRLNLLLVQSKKYEATNTNRGNKNVIVAVERMLHGISTS